MRILSLSNSSLDPNQGSGQVILALMNGLRQQGHDVDLFGPDDYEVYRWMRPRANSYRRAIGMWLHARLQLKRAKYDVLAIWGGEGWLAFNRINKISHPNLLRISLSNGLESHVGLCLAPADKTSRRWWQLNQSDWMATGFKNADALTVVSNFDRDFALRQGYQPPDRVVTTEPGLHPAFLGLPFVPERTPIIGFCGSWLPRKGIELMRIAIPTILQELPSVRALLVGVGRKFRVEDWFSADVRSRVETVPWVDTRSELINFYRSMSVALMPSYYESFGLVAAEAMACGAAVITSKSGFGTSLQNGENAVVLDSLNAKNLTQSLRQLLKEETLRRRLAEAGHKRVQSLRWEQTIITLNKTIQRWVAEKKVSDCLP